ncbi:MAG TPA: hypothetical protein VM077_03155 [Candidatus Limnocylindrales bacterium]|nr:hypothetical protein [Candidatus Limnocylindrales bacterium]
MIILERRNSEPIAKLKASGVLFDRGCFMVTSKGKGVEQSQDSPPPRDIKSFSDCSMFDGLPDRIRAKEKREIRYWIQAGNRRSQ